MDMPAHKLTMPAYAVRHGTLVLSPNHGHGSFLLRHRITEADVEKQALSVANAVLLTPVEFFSNSTDDPVRRRVDLIDLVVCDREAPMELYFETGSNLTDYLRNEGTSASGGKANAGTHLLLVVRRFGRSGNEPAEIKLIDTYHSESQAVKEAKQRTMARDVTPKDRRRHSDIYPIAYPSDRAVIVCTHPSGYSYRELSRDQLIDMK